MRTPLTRKLADAGAFRKNAVYWASQFEHAVCLDSNGHHSEYSSFDFLVAADAQDVIVANDRSGFDDLQKFYDKHRDWVFGCVGYDLKNGLEDLDSHNFDGIAFPDLVFFRPKKLMILRGDELRFLYLDEFQASAEDDLDKILNGFPSEPKVQPLEISPRITPAGYLEKVTQMKRHIALGDIYEANFCMEFFASGIIDPVGRFHALNALSQAPFSAFVRIDDRYVISASPERFLRKQGKKLISQPIKGTAARSDDPALDTLNAASLQADEKERAENIMIVDLVRNDLSRTAARGSVRVEELCGVHSFKQVHQLISTVTSELREGCTGFDALRTAFPMGSMTGAPKISALKIIEQLEESRRGMYSGSVGYITPDGDFDFNVVIRTILYNAKDRYVSFHVGSAITDLSDPEREYAECLLKARAMTRVLDR